METDNGNILICKFMGYSVKEGSGGFLIRYYPDGRYGGEFHNKRGGGNGNEYHRDWNQLMSVIKKMQDISVEDENMFHLLNGVYDSLLSLDIFETWKYVVSVLKERGQ